MEKAYSILIESFRVVGAAVFWSLTLSIALLLFPLAALWANTTSLRSGGIAGLGHFRRSPISI